MRTVSSTGLPPPSPRAVSSSCRPSPCVHDHTLHLSRPPSALERPSVPRIFPDLCRTTISAAGSDISTPSQKGGILLALFVVYFVSIAIAFPLSFPKPKDTPWWKFVLVLTVGAYASSLAATLDLAMLIFTGLLSDLMRNVLFRVLFFGVGMTVFKILNSDLRRCLRRASSCDA